MKIIIALLTLSVSLTSFATPDFSCVCIERTPKCNRYQVRYDVYKPYLQAGTEDDQRWPNPGETVTYYAHMYNAGDTAGTCTYRWKTNGVIAETGNVTLSAGEFTSNTFTMSWPAGGETLEGAVDITYELNYDSGASEVSATNNTITITTRDLTLTFFMSQEYFDALSAKQNVWGTYSAVDWTRSQFEDMHDKFAESVHPATPSGIVERVRVDKFIIVPNSQMQSALNNDPLQNKNDGRWQIWGNDPSGYANIFGHRIDYGLIHEIGHQLGLIDIYQYDVDGQNVLVTEDGGPLLYPHVASQQGMMRTHGDLPFSEFSSVGLNSQQGRRRGYYGDFQFAIPKTNILKIVDANSSAISGATVRCYRRDGAYFEDNDLLWEGVTDANGEYSLPNAGASYSTSNGWTLYPNPFAYVSVVGGNMMLIQVQAPTAPGIDTKTYAYDWFECIASNIRYWKGDSNVAVYTIETQLQKDPALAPPPADVLCRMAGNTGNVEVQPPPGATGIAGYRFYTAGFEPYDNDLTLYTETTVPSCTVSPASSRRYITASIMYTNGAAQESSVSRLAYIPYMPSYNPGANQYLAGITFLPGGQRLVCVPTPTHEEPLWQLPNGNFMGMFSSIHNHLRPLDAAYDASLGRVIITDMPDGYNGDYRIRVVDDMGRTLSNPFGSSGSGDGQFNVPAGVAVDSSSRILVADKGNNRVQAFSSSGSFITKFTGLNQPRGIEVDSADRILVADTGNGRVQILTWSGSTLVDAGTITHSGFSSPTDVACGVNDEIFVTDSGANAVFAFDSSDNYVTNYMQPNDGSGGSLNSPYGIACGAGNMLVVSDSGNRRVVEIHTQEDAEIYSFLINGGAPETDSTNVTLTLSASSRAEEMRIASTLTALSTTPWQTYASSIGWTIEPLLGTPQTLYAQVRDADENVSSIASATITYVEEVTPRRYISADGNDADTGMSWSTAKRTLSAAITSADPETYFYIGTGTFSGAGNFNIDITGHENSVFIGEGPDKTVFTSGTDENFMYNLDMLTAPIAFHDMAISYDSFSMSGTKAVFFFGSSGHGAHLILSNVWLSGSYDGNLPDGSNGTDGRFNGSALYFSRWGGGSYYEGNITATHCLFDQWGAAMRFNDIQSDANVFTAKFNKCTIVNCASTASGAGIDNSVFWLRGNGDGRVYYFTDCVMSHCATDAGCVSDIRFISTTLGPVHMNNNLVYLPSLPSGRVYMENSSYYTGTETDVTDIDPMYISIDGKPYSLIYDGEAVNDRGWYTVLPEPMTVSWLVGVVLLHLRRL